MSEMVQNSDTLQTKRIRNGIGFFYTQILRMRAIGIVSLF